MLYKNFITNLNYLISNLSVSKIAVAVSGGSDSTALLYLTSNWANKHNVKLFIISVDHNLRPEAKLENQYIKELCNKLGHNYYILNFDHKNNFSNLQARAREARYELMTNLCQELDILVLLTAHHQDDYVENFLMRLERKSGIFGLSSNNINWYNNTQIIRPLFNMPKTALINYLIDNNIKWFEDESNLSDKYRRNTIRKKLTKEEQYKKTDIEKERLEINSSLKNKFQPELIKAIAESVKIYQYGFACLDLLKFHTFLNEIKIQLLNFLLIIIGGNKNTVRFYSIETILNLISNNIRFKNSLHNCIIKKEQNNLLIYKELGKKQPVDVILQNKPIIWNKRFYISPICSNFEERYTITYLSLNDYKAIKNQIDLTLLKKLTFRNHIEILFTFPVIKILEKIIAMPHISYYYKDNINFDVSFTSSFTSRFTHFY